MKKVLVGISGGVDSAVACYFLQQAGYEVTALTLIVNNNEQQKLDMKDAKSICRKLGIKHIVRDVSEDFKKEVIDYFVDEYKNGRTPNPCCKCNKDIKMKYLLQIAKELGFEKYATGHYARRCIVEYKNEKRYAIKIAGCEAKDQAYMLYKLTQEQIKNLILPLSYLNKEQVRNIAKHLGLNVFSKKDSLDVCFIKDMNYIEFIKRYEFGEDYKEQIASGNTTLLNKMDNAKFLLRGHYVDSKNKILGFHEGIINYTVGQRKGLNIALAKKAYVIKINPDNLDVVLGDVEELFQKECYIKDVNFQGIKEFEENEKFENCICKIRYKDKGEKCNIKKQGDVLKVEFEKPVRAITSGQAAVFYFRDVIIAGGTII